ncbi:PIN domain-containing protein [Deinococcus arcticus]|uniref:PIN domain-containing protein n=1 Tax=Deinococcus arcticus TaxID=2136176 RepID=UPI0022B89C68|nr:PIN domain-containing protein [Deinococcus arcticus]
MDTDTISLAVRGEGAVRRHLAATPLTELAVSSVTLMELEFGLSLKPARRAAVEAALSLWLPQVTVLDYGPQDALITAHIRVALRQQGQPTQPYDLLNAGMALARGLMLVTHNTREYERVDGLRLADWMGDTI